MADIDVVTVITLLKTILVGGIQADSDVRERIKDLDDEGVVGAARELIADTDKRAGEFIERLEGEV